MNRKSRSQQGSAPKSPLLGRQEEGILEALRLSQLTDPLTEVSRRERKSLLAVSLIALAITVGNLIPTEISTLGVRVSSAERAGLLLTLALTLAYFLFAFIVYGVSDLFDWRLRIKLFFKTVRRSVEPVRDEVARRELQRSDDWADAQRWAAIKDEIDLAKELIAASRTRVGFELLVPISFGIFSLGLVLDSYVTVSKPSPWKVVLTFPWSLLPLVLLVFLFGVAWWRWYRKKTAPVRRMKKTSGRLSAITAKMRRVGSLSATDPERNELLDEVHEDLRNLHRD